MSAKPVVGVIGAIGAGKSTVARRLVELGGKLIDGDAVGHKVLREPAIKNKVMERFGRDILGADGEIDRRKLGRIVFSDPQLLESLERIMHPRMKEIFREEIAAAQREESVKVVVFDAAILLEAGWGDMMDVILYIDADRGRREERVKSRGWDAAELRRREAAQWPAQRRMAQADFVITNDDGEACRREVDALFRRWTASERADATAGPELISVNEKDA